MPIVLHCASHFPCVWGSRPFSPSPGKSEELGAGLVVDEPSALGVCGPLESVCRILCMCPCAFFEGENPQLSFAFQRDPWPQLYMAMSFPEGPSTSPTMEPPRDLCLTSKLLNCRGKRIQSTNQLPLLIDKIWRWPTMWTDTRAQEPDHFCDLGQLLWLFRLRVFMCKEWITVLVVLVS